ncbi:hypothetical protein C8F01DRAFT_1176380 [Mycena amicta]|nr:hypothetical protein C8F01DRAFT_1176380 [Mycena amicta]
MTSTSTGPAPPPARKPLPQKTRLATRRAQRRADPVLREQDRVRVQAANRAYRAKHADRLVEYDRHRRAAAYAKKYGLDAFVQREAERRSLMEEAAEEEYLRQLEKRLQDTEGRRRQKQDMQRELAEEDEERQAVVRAGRPHDVSPMTMYPSD